MADTEDIVVREVKKVIEMFGLRIQRINTGCFKVGGRFIRSAQKGTLDFEGYDNHGRFVGIECKRRNGGKVSPEQAERIDDIISKGGVAGVVTSAEDCIALLNANNCV